MKKGDAEWFQMYYNYQRVLRYMDQMPTFIQQIQLIMAYHGFMMRLIGYVIRLRKRKALQYIKGGW